MGILGFGGWVGMADFWDLGVSANCFLVVFGVWCLVVVIWCTSRCGGGFGVCVPCCVWGLVWGGLLGLCFGLLVWWACGSGVCARWLVG